MRDDVFRGEEGVPSPADDPMGFSFALGEGSLSALDLDLQADSALLVQNVMIAPNGSALAGRTILDLVVPADRAVMREAAEEVLVSGGITRVRLRLDLGDSPYVLFGLAKLSGGLPLGVSGLFLDEETSMYGSDIDESSLYRELFERLPISAYFRDQNSAILQANTNMIRDLGFSHPRDVIGKPSEELFDPSDVRFHAPGDAEVRSSGMPMIGVTEVETLPDGSSKVVHVSRFPVRNRDGEIVGTMGFSHDVTQSARVVDALALSEQRYALAAEASRDGIWDYDVENQTYDASPRTCTLLGIPPTSDPISAYDLAPLFAERDLARINRAFKRVIDGVDDRVHELFSIEASDGKQSWVEIIGAAFTVDGRVTRIVGSAADVTEDRERESRLQYLARHDPLTGLANRRVLVQKVNEALRSEAASWLLSLDLDNFKVINDSLGHQAGDDVLCQIADRLRSVAGSEHLLGRLGGDEFAMLIRDRDRDAVEVLVADITEALREVLYVSGLDLYTTVSTGVVHLNETYVDANQAFRDADIALYSAKSHGKARHEIFEPELRAAADDELDRQVFVRRAVRNNAFFLMFQPIFDTNTRQLTGVEALLRLAQEDGTIETPTAFLPYLEQTELIMEVGEWVVEEALSTLAGWREHNLVGDNFRVALNVSRKQFQTERLATVVLDAVERHGLAGEDVVLEVTETAVAHEDSELAPTLEHLRSKGIKIALDDFGTGQSSLAVLHDLPVDILKIDKSFTSRINAENEEPVTRAALWLAKSMGLVTVAEGVETESQFEWLIDHGCEMVQGYLLGKPMMAAEIPQLFNRLQTVIQPAEEEEQPWDFDDEEAREAAWAALNARSTKKKSVEKWAEQVSEGLEAIDEVYPAA